MTASQQFERLSPSDTACWSTLARDLRAEAEQLTGGRRQQLIDRAELCEYRARKAVRR